MSLIRLENVSLARQGKTLLSGLNWTVEKGQTWAILGLNGAGKSTLLRLLTAEFFPSEGKAEILGYTLVMETSRVLNVNTSVSSGLKDFYHWASASTYDC